MTRRRDAAGMWLSVSAVVLACWAMGSGWYVAEWTATVIYCTLYCCTLTCITDSQCSVVVICDFQIISAQSYITLTAYNKSSGPAPLTHPDCL